MPSLFRQRSLAPMTVEQAERKQQVVSDAQITLDDYERKLKSLPRTEKLYRKKELLIEWHSKELTKLITNKSYEEHERIKKIIAFNETLQAAIHLLDELQALKDEIDKPANDISESKAFKHNKNKLIHEAANEFIPTAAQVYNKGLGLAYELLHQHGLHQKGNKNEFDLLTKVIQHTAAAVKDPENKTNIATLLNDTKMLSKHLGTDYWQVFFGAVAAFTGTCIYVTGEIMFLTGVLAPLGATLFAAGVGIYFAGAAVIANEFNTKKSQVSANVSHLNHLVNQATKLFPEKPIQKTSAKKSIEEIELQALVRSQQQTQG